NMWEFPNARVQADPAKELTKALQSQTKILVRQKEAIGVVSHAYTHFKVTEHIFLCDPVSVSQDKTLKWVKVDELEEFPMGKIDRQIALMLKKRRSPST